MGIKQRRGLSKGGRGRQHSFIGNKLANRAEIKEFLFGQLQNVTQEVLAILLLDQECCVLHFDQIAKASLEAGTIYPREIIRRALEHKAYAVVLARSLPTKEPLFNRSQVMFTKTLKRLLVLVDVHVIDHVVVTQGACVSLAERGQL